jgi:hypothetical protein
MERFLLNHLPYHPLTHLARTPGQAGSVRKDELFREYSKLSDFNSFERGVFRFARLPGRIPGCLIWNKQPAPGFSGLNQGLINEEIIEGDPIHTRELFVPQKKEYITQNSFRPLFLPPRLPSPVSRHLSLLLQLSRIRTIMPPCSCQLLLKK